MGIVPHHLGVSVKDTNHVLEKHGSHKAFKERHQRASLIFDLRRRFQRTAAIGATKIRIRGKWRFLWAAVDVGLKET